MPTAADRHDAPTAIQTNLAAIFISLELSRSICARLKSGIGRETMRRRGELVERSFAHILDRGGTRRAWLRGRENVHKRYLIHVAGFNLGILMRALHGHPCDNILHVPDERAAPLIGVVESGPRSVQRR